MGSASQTRPTDLDAPYRRLLEELLANDEEDLRLVFAYDEDSVDLVYVREDLLEEDLLPRVNDEHTRALNAWSQTDGDARQVYGDLEITVAIREAAIVLHFLGSEREGIVAVADRTGDVVGQLLGL